MKKRITNKKHNKRISKNNTKRKRVNTRKKTNRRTKKQYGGIFVPSENQKGAFQNFVMNSTCRVISAGAYGIVFELTLNAEFKSPYKYSSLENYEQEVRTICVKLIPIEHGDTTYTLGDFEREVDMQLLSFKRSIQYLQPVTPGIIYHDIIEDDSKGILSKMLKSIDSIPANDEYFVSKCKNIRKKINSSDVSVGLIAMEFIQGYRTLNEILTSRNNDDPVIDKQVKSISFLYCLFIVLYATAVTGILHGDCHPGNVLVKFDVDYFRFSTADLKNNPLSLFTGGSGAPIILDFGFARELSQEELKALDLQLHNLRGYVKNIFSLMTPKPSLLFSPRNYVSAIRLLCSFQNSKGHRLDKPNDSSFLYQFKLYGWFCNYRAYNSHRFLSNGQPIYSYDIPTSDEKLNYLLDILFMARNRFIQGLLNKQKRRQLYANLPPLPLSKQIIDDKGPNGTFYNYLQVWARKLREDKFENDLSPGSKRLGVGDVKPETVFGRAGGFDVDMDLFEESSYTLDDL